MSSVDLGRTVLIVADLQRATLEGRSRESGQLLVAARAALDAARAAGVPVVHVRVAFQTGHPEVSPHNKVFSALLGSGFMLAGSAEAEFHPTVAPAPSEPIVTKHRVGAFRGTDLEQVLRSRGLDHLVLAGYATSGVVLSTVRDAADRDFRLTVLADAVDDDDPEVQEVLLTRVFPRQAEVVDVAAFGRAITP